MFIRKSVLANQRSERCFSHVKRMISPIRMANDVFSRVKKKNDMSNQRSQRCVSFVRKFRPFKRACSLQRPRFASASQTFNEKSFSWRRVFLGNSSGTVSSTSICRDLVKQLTAEVENRGRGKLKLCFLVKLRCLLFTYIQIGHFI